MTEWQEKTLGEVLTLQRGFDLPKKQRLAGSVPIVSSSGVSGTHNVQKVRGPGVVTGRYGTLGEVFYIREDFWPLNTTLFVNDFKENDQKFVYYALKSLRLEDYNGAGAVPGLNRNVLHRLSITLPPLSTQRKIASVLSAYDDLIENNTRRIEILEETARMVYREWFVDFRFPGHEQVGMVDSPLGKIPEEWAVTSTSAEVEINPRTKISKSDEILHVPMSSLLLNSMLINDIETRTGNSGTKFKNGDTLFARITPSLENGKTGYVQFLSTDVQVATGSTEFIVLRPKKLTSEFVYLMSRTDEFRENAIKSMTGASGRQRVQTECFDKFLIPHPDRETLGAFSDVVSPMFKYIQSLAKKKENLRRARDLLLPRLVSGEVSVEDVEVG